MFNLAKQKLRDLNGVYQYTVGGEQLIFKESAIYEYLEDRNS